jgi:hypothetical protein
MSLLMDSPRKRKPTNQQILKEIIPNITDYDMELLILMAKDLHRLNTKYCNEAIKQIEISILSAYGFFGVNNDNFNEYENTLLDILEGYRRVCYLDKIKE